MNNFIKLSRSEDAQKVATFTGEGAYHGSSKNLEVLQPKDNEELESLPTSLIEYVKNKNANFNKFLAVFKNSFMIKSMMNVPTQEEVKNDMVTFCWCPFDQALQEAGPLTKNVLLNMEKHLERKKKFIYIDSKIQYFNKGDLPVDSKLWHIDGSIAIRDQRSKDLGYDLLHDMRARFDNGVFPKYLAYQSSYHCATEFVTEPIAMYINDCISNFEPIDQLVVEAKPKMLAQPAGSIVSFDGFSLHRAVPAKENGWRLWIRCTETDREIKINSSVMSCYGTVFKKDK